MGDRSKFEQMLEYLINDEEARARELFHDIVVAKSREIYENLLADDFEEEETEESRDDDEDDVDISIVSDKTIHDIIEILASALRDPKCK